MLKFWKKKDNRGREFTSDDRQKSATVRRMKGMEREQMRMMEDEMRFLMDQRRMAMMEERLGIMKEQILPQYDDDDDDDDFDDVPDTPEAMLMQLFTNAQQNKAQQPQPTPEQTTLTESNKVIFTDAELLSIIDNIPKNAIKMFKKMPHTIRMKLVQSHLPNLDLGVVERINNMIK